MDVHKRLRDNIGLLMQQRGMADVVDLARAAKVAPNTIHNARKLRYSISLSSLAKIARALGVDVYQLLVPTAMLDENMAGEIGPLMDDYWQATAKGRGTIREVAAAQAFAATRDSVRAADPSADSTD